LLLRCRIKGRGWSGLETSSVTKSSNAVISRLVGDLIGEMRGDNNNSLTVPDDDIAGKTGASPQPIGPLISIAWCSVSWSELPVGCGTREGKLSKLRRVAKTAVRNDPAQPRTMSRDIRMEPAEAARVFATVDDEHGPGRTLLDATLCG
jgi:hypothetical protein